MEGDEYSVIDDLCCFSNCIDSVSLEFHNICSNSDVFFDSITLLKEHYTIVHVHLNNYTNLCREFGLSDCLEVTFVNKRYDTVLLSEYWIPTELDSPCDPKRPDHKILIKSV